MQAIEFQHLADVLAGAGPFEKARQRSAVSRAYYATFLEARDKITREFGNVLPKHLAHDKVWKSYLRSEEPLKSIGRGLKDLKEMREQADYDLVVETDSPRVSEALSLAKRLQEELSKVSAAGCQDPRTV